MIDFDNMTKNKKMDAMEEYRKSVGKAILLCYYSFFTVLLLWDSYIIMEFYEKVKAFLYIYEESFFWEMFFGLFKLFFSITLLKYFKASYSYLVREYYIITFKIDMDKMGIENSTVEFQNGSSNE